MSVLEELGRETTGFFSYAGGAALLLADCAAFIGRLRIRVRETIDQAYILGVQSWAIVFLTSLCTGMVFSLESANQAVQYGVGNLVGGAVAFTMARELRWRANWGRCSRPWSSPAVPVQRFRPNWARWS
jgi:phospholipid/cholesterol/gamma-HCH transport system permease protein